MRCMCNFDGMKTGGDALRPDRLPLGFVRIVEYDALANCLDGVVYKLEHDRLSVALDLEWVESFLNKGGLLLLTDNGEPVSTFRANKERRVFVEEPLNKYELPECRECGACCALPKWHEVAVDVTDEDVARMSKNARKALVIAEYGGEGEELKSIPAKWRFQQGGPFDGCDLCVCHFLRGSVLGKCSCGIYARRPEACREFKRGSNECWASVIEWRRLAKKMSKGGQDV